MDAKHWNGDDDRPHGSSDGSGRADGRSYRCVDCDWRGKDAAKHHYMTGHAVRGAKWPETWPNAKFSDAGADGRCAATMRRTA